MSIAQPLLDVVPGDFEGGPLVDFDGDEPEAPDVAGVLDVSAVFLVLPPEPAVSAEVDVDVDVEPAPASELEDSLFDVVLVFDEARLSVL
jgi:hypothetical protein